MPTQRLKDSGAKAVPRQSRRSSPGQDARILLVDDHQMVRESLRLLIDAQPDMKVVAEAGNGSEAIQKARQFKPSVVIMDLAMPGMNGFEAIIALKQELPPLKIIALTMHDDEIYLMEACRAGVYGYVLKQSAGSVLLHTIRVVLCGQVHFDSRLAAKTLVSNQTRWAAPGGELSLREKQVLRSLAWGRTNKEIAAELSVSIKTVETYRMRIGDKLGLRSRTQMVQHAILHGWLNSSALSPPSAP